MATIPKIIADFEAQLASAVSVGSTSFTISTATDDDGVALPGGLYYFTIDNGSTNKEYLAGTLSGTSVTGVVTVSRQGVEVSGAARAHRVGASVIITDFATYKKYMDALAIGGAPDASNSTKGITKLSVAPASEPIAVGDNDPRVPTQGENDGLAATTTPASTNLFVTQKDLQKGTVIFAADAGSTDAYAITLSPAPAAYVAGMVFRFKANTLNTGAASLNVNGLGAITIKKSFNIDLATGDIVAGQYVEVIYDGTNFQLLSSATSAIAGGSVDRDVSLTSTLNIPHGLGVIPRYVRIATTWNSSPNAGPILQFSTAEAIYASGAASYCCNAFSEAGGSTGSTGRVVTGSFALYTQISSGGDSANNGTLTIDATNIILTWSKTSSPTGTFHIIWEAFA